jgi:hypothetical protein
MEGDRQRPVAVDDLRFEMHGGGIEGFRRGVLNLLHL